MLQFDVDIDTTLNVKLDLQSFRTRPHSKLRLVKYRNQDSRHLLIIKSYLGLICDLLKVRVGLEITLYTTEIGVGGG